MTWFGPPLQETEYHFSGEEVRVSDVLSNLVPDQIRSAARSLKSSAVAVALALDSMQTIWSSTRSRTTPVSIRK